MKLMTACRHLPAALGRGPPVRLAAEVNKHPRRVVPSITCLSQFAPETVSILLRLSTLLTFRPLRRHPCRHHDEYAGRYLDMNEIAAGAPLDICRRRRRP